MEELNNPQVESSSQVEETTQTPQDGHNQEEAQAKSDAEKNFVALRQAREKAERERDEYLQRLKQYEEQQKKAEPAKKEKYRDPSDLAEYQDLMELRKEMEEQRRQQEQLSMEIKLRQSYPDIDQVLSADNIAKFREQEPELAEMLNENKNIYKKAAVAYKYIKKMGLGQEDPYKKEKEQIAANSAKPKSSAGISKGTPLSQMNDFVDNPEEYRKRLWKEMQAAINSR